MLNRRLIRIKTFQALFGELGEQNSSAEKIISSVKKSMSGLKSNLFSVLSYGPELSHYLSIKQNPLEFKYKPTEEDVQTYKFIVENPFFLNLANHQVYAKYAQHPTLKWQDEEDVMFLMYKEFKNSDTYKACTSNPSEHNPIEFAKSLYKYLILDSVEFEQLMEDKNIFWYDEKIPILKSVEKIFNDLETSEEITIPSIFRNEDEDLAMVDNLVEQYSLHNAELQKELSNYTPKWDSDRITKIDYLLILMALLEFKYMPEIPVKVTMNEYIEIAKMYSTPKSSKFVNGTLDKILKEWKNKNLIQKKGRGLIG
jgi:N utilization substance protein B